MLQRLPIALAQVKADNISENLLNKIRQIIYFLYWAYIFYIFCIFYKIDEYYIYEFCN